MGFGKYRRIAGVVLAVALWGAGPAGAKVPETPVGAGSARREVRLEGGKRIEVELHRVAPGEWLYKILRQKGCLGRRALTGCVELVKELNRPLDLQRLRPGQVIRIPLRVLPKEMPDPGRGVPEETGLQEGLAGLKRIFLDMGEGWIETGETAIALGDSGKLRLDAERFPVIAFRHGRKIVLDPGGRLGARETELLRAGAPDWTLVRWDPAVPAAEAVGRILQAARYDAVFQGDRLIRLEDGIQVELAADWIVVHPSRFKGGGAEYVALVLGRRSGNADPARRALRDYLAGRGVKVVEHPREPAAAAAEPDLSGLQVSRSGADTRSVVRSILTAAGRSHQEQVEIPIRRGEGGGAASTVKADFLLPVDGQDAVIDTGGLSAEALRFLAAHRFRVLSLGGAADRLQLARETLEFLGIAPDAGAARLASNMERPIRLSLPGLGFSGAQGHKVFACPVALSPGLTALLNQKGYAVLILG